VRLVFMDRSAFGAVSLCARRRILKGDSLSEKPDLAVASFRAMQAAQALETSLARAVDLAWLASKDEFRSGKMRLGANTLSRWESGRNVQTEATDTLLRLIRDVPGSIEYLRHHAA